MTSLLWFRQDLRVHDNAALTTAAQAGDVVPVYVLDETNHPWGLGGASAWWLHHSLASLAKSLAARGSTLILRRGNPAVIIPALARETGASAIHATRHHEPAWRAADAAVTAALKPGNTSLHLHDGATLFHPDAIRTKTGGIYGVFTPFARAAAAMGDPPPPVTAPKSIAAPPRRPPSDRLEDWALLPIKPDWAGGLREAWVPGEPAARARAKTFLDSALATYTTGRNLPGQDLTARLSPHLHWGEISAGELWHALRRREPSAGATTWRNELIWRDFAAYLLWHKPALPDHPLRLEFEPMPWRDDPNGLRAWQKGQTGVPIVDAGMRQLWQTGWMHNRVRMIAASFLIKHLLIDWRHGAAWFWDTLVDADLASNSTNWQWVAGTGIDAQPFFRVFNPVTQGQKFDADGAYVRHFVPELARLPDAVLHAPWTALAATLSSAGIILGKTYPTPLVGLDDGRRRALDVYRAAVRQNRQAA
jgi:deoxyribodipyrimidine photo-lyase